MVSYQVVSCMQPPYCHGVMNLAIKALQIGLVGVGAEHFLTCFVDRFGLEAWLYDEGFNANKSQLSGKLNALHQLGNPIHRRHKEHHDLPEIVTLALDNLKPYEAFVTAADAKWDHIPQEERAVVLKECEALKAWLADSQAKVAAQSKVEDPKCTCQDVRNKVQELFNKCNPVVNKPKPEPKTKPKTNSWRKVSKFTNMEEKE